jgi:hypothetical protein
MHKKRSGWTIVFGLFQCQFAKPTTPAVFFQYTKSIQLNPVDLLPAPNHTAYVEIHNDTFK